MCLLPRFFPAALVSRPAAMSIAMEGVGDISAYVSPDEHTSVSSMFGKELEGPIRYVVQLLKRGH